MDQRFSAFLYSNDTLEFWKVLRITQEEIPLKHSYEYKRKTLIKN